MTTSTGTQPVRDRAYWTAVIHNAARVNPDHPRYDEARQVIQVALDNLDSNAQRQNAADTPPTPMPSKVRGAAMSALQGLTAGFGDEAMGGIAGLATLLTGGGPTQTVNRIHQTQEGFREQQSNFMGQHPAIAIASDLYGTAASPLNRILGPLTEGLGPVARGAVLGTTLGGLRGLGEGTGTIGQRLPAAGAGAAIGFVAGSVLGKAVKTVGPTVGRMAQNVRKLLGPGATASEVDNVVEGTIRKRLAKLNVAAEDIETAIKSWRTTGELSVKRLSAPPPEPPAPPTVRAGETITPTRPAPIVGTRPPGLPNTDAELLTMEPDAIAKTAKALQQHEQGAAEAVFGPTRAKQYEAAQRLVNGSMGHTREGYAAASKLIDQMESDLTPAQQQRLFGIGEKGPTFETVRELARHAGNYRPDILADMSPQELQASFSALAGGERPTDDMLARYALPRLYRELSSRGIPDAEIISRTLSRMGERGINSETAGEALAARMGEWGKMFAPSPAVARAGETITPIAGKGFEVTGTRATPPAPSTPSFWDQVYGPPLATKAMPDIGRGQTVPYYPRGGVVEQAFGAPPVSSMPANTLAPQQVQLLRQFLQGATPADLPSRLDVMRAVGIPLPADAEAQLLPMLTGGH